MKHTKQVLFLSLMLFGLFIAAGIAQAAVTVTLVTPAASGRVSGTAYRFNCTAAATTGENMTNASFYYGTTLIGTNSTNGGTQWAYNWNSTSVNDYITDFKCVVGWDKNVSTAEDSSADCYIDNTVPTCTWSTPASSSISEPGVTFTAIVTNVSGEDSFCTLSLDNNIYVPTLSSTSCTYTKVGEPPVGHYSTATFTVSDGTNSTTCSATSLTITKDEYIAAQQYQITQLQNQQQNILLQQTQKNKGLVIVLIAAVLYYFFVYKKKKR